MGVFAGTERQCTEDEHDYKDDSQISEFGIKRSAFCPWSVHVLGALLALLAVRQYLALAEDHRVWFCRTILLA